MNLAINDIIFLMSMLFASIMIHWKMGKYFYGEVKEQLKRDVAAKIIKLWEEEDENNMHSR